MVRTRSRSLVLPVLVLSGWRMNVLLGLPFRRGRVLVWSWLLFRRGYGFLLLAGRMLMVVLREST
jgi:hypothetical protein